MLVGQEIPPLGPTAASVAEGDLDPTRTNEVLEVAARTYAGDADGVAAFLG